MTNRNFSDASTGTGNGARGRLWQSWLNLRLSAISALFVLGTLGILLFPVVPRRGPYDLAVGTVASEDIRATRQITYISSIETEEAREAARTGVSDVYDPADPRVGRQQVRRAQQILDFIDTVRADSQADLLLKQRYVAQIETLTLSEERQQQFIAIGDTQFGQAEREIVRLIEDAMSGPVREGRVEEVTERLELRVSTDVPEDLVPLIVGVSTDLIVPNSMLNEEATAAARAEAESGVPDIRHTFQPGETVVEAGKRINELDREALEAVGLAAEQLTWEAVASMALASILAFVAILVYLRSMRPDLIELPTHLFILTVLFLLFLAAAQAMIPATSGLTYLFPAAALSLSVTAFVGVEFAALLAAVMAGFTGLIASGSLEITAFIGLSSILAAGSLRRNARLNSFFLAGIFAALAGIAVLLVFRLPIQTTSARMIQLISLAVLNGLVSAGLALVILFVVGNITGITTSIQLIELARPDHPLQRKLQQEALGTYQHSLSVVNLVEAAVEAIGGDSLLARVGALYHDIGKTTNPGFFVENRLEGGESPHDRLAPAESAQIIKNHVSDGVRLARKQRLPSTVIAFIPQHHGTMPILYFLNQAKVEAEQSSAEFDESQFYYDGPIPQSREAAILMLADGAESVVRANRPDADELETVVSRIIQQRIDFHQLDQSGLTLTELATIKDTFVRMLRGMYHPRIKYPGDEKPQARLEGSGSPALLPEDTAEKVDVPVPAINAVVEATTSDPGNPSDTDADNAGANGQ